MDGVRDCRARQSEGALFALEQQPMLEPSAESVSARFDGWPIEKAAAASSSRVSSARGSS